MSYENAYVFFSDQNSSLDLTDSEDIDGDDLNPELPNLNQPFIPLDTPINTNPNSSVNPFELSESLPGDPPSTPPIVPPDKQLGSPPNVLKCDPQQSPPNTLYDVDFNISSHKDVSSQNSTINQQSYQAPQNAYSIMYGNSMPLTNQNFYQNNFLYQSSCQFQYFPQNYPYNFSMTSFCCNDCSFNGTLCLCKQITSANDMKAYLQRKITGNSGTRFNKKTLHYLYEIFALHYHWGPLTRAEKRNKMHVFKRLFENKFLVIDYIQKCPSIIDQVLLKKIISTKKTEQ